MNNETAKRLFEYRKANGYSQEELAEKIGVSRQAISKWERGESSPDTDNLIVLSRLYGITIDELLNVAPTPKKAEFKEPENDENATNSEKVCDEQNEKSTSGINNENSNFNNDSFNACYDSTGQTQNSNFRYNNCNDKSQQNPWLHALLPIGIVILYLILGFTTRMGWAFGWILFLLIPVVETAVSAIKTKNPSRFVYPVFIVFLYLLIGFLFNTWHPTWILFITIPMYYAVCEAYKKTRKDKFDDFTQYNNAGATYYSPDGSQPNIPYQPTVTPARKKSFGGALAAIIITIILAIVVISIAGMCFSYGFITNSSSETADNIGNIISNFSDYSDFNYDSYSETGYSIGSAEINADAIRDIEIDWVSSDITIQYYDKNTITFSEPEQVSEDYALRYKVEDSTLKIKFLKPGKTKKLSDTMNKELVIYLPQNLSLNELEIDSVSSNIYLKELSAYELSVDTVSGNLKAYGNYNIIDFDSVSGNAEITNSTMPSELSIGTVSGDGVVALPDDANGFTLDYSVVSGSINGDDFGFATIKEPKTGNRIYGNGIAEIDFNSISGNFEIKMK